MHGLAGMSQRETAASDARRPQGLAAQAAGRIDDPGVDDAGAWIFEWLT